MEPIEVEYLFYFNSLEDTILGKKPIREILDVSFYSPFTILHYPTGEKTAQDKKYMVTIDISVNEEQLRRLDSKFRGIRGYQGLMIKSRTTRLWKIYQDLENL